MAHDPTKYRNKPTSIDQTLPGVATWPPEKLRRYAFFDLDGNRTFIQPSEFASKDPYPLPMPVDREGYLKEENSDRYWASGLADWLNVAEAIQRYGNGLASTSSILDFGCASGRFLRHAAFQTAAPIQVYGCDLAPANIDWMKKHLPSSINKTVNSNDPCLPFKDSSFDIVTAFSVFTHIDKSEESWLLELKRVIKPDGLLYVTIHNEASWNRISYRPATIRQFEHQNSFEENLEVTPEMMSGSMPHERMVFRKDHELVYNCNVWHSNGYVAREWSKHFEILHIADNAHGNFQSPVIMRSV